MTLPNSLDIFDGAPIREKEALTIRAFDESGELVLVTVNQRASAMFSNPGRLLFNGRLIEIRSDEEDDILDLLENASINPLQDDDDRIGVIDILPLPIQTVDMLQFLIAAIVKYVESEEYEQIGRNGLDKHDEPWNIRRIGM